MISPHDFYRTATLKLGWVWLVKIPSLQSRRTSTLLAKFSFLPLKCDTLRGKKIEVYPPQTRIDKCFCKELKENSCGWWPGAVSKSVDFSLEVMDVTKREENQGRLYWYMGSMFARSEMQKNKTAAESPHVAYVLRASSSVLFCFLCQCLVICLMTRTWLFWKEKIRCDI